MIKNTYRSIIFLLLLSCIQLDAEGILEGTLVVTPQGLQCIESLSVGNIVVCYDFRTSCSTQHNITHINNHTSNHLIQLTINGDMLLVDVHQRIYLPIEQRWCQAKNLTPGNIILASVDNMLHYLVLDNVKVVDDAYDVYELTVPVYHNFYISKYGVITHNVMVLDDIAIASLPSLLTFAATTVATIATKIMTVLSFLCATPVALTSTQATVAAAATAISVGGSMLHDSYKARRAQQSSEQKQCETCTPESDSYTIRVHDNLYTCKEKLGMPSMSERVHLNLGPDKPGPTCPSHNPTKTVTYYDAKGNLLTGKQLAMVKKEDLSRRQAVRDWRLPPPLPPLLPIQQPDIMPNTCPVSTETKERKEPSISTCPAAPDTKEPIPACGLQQADVPALSKQSCSPIVEEHVGLIPYNNVQTPKTEITNNVEIDGLIWKAVSEVKESKKSSRKNKDTYKVSRPHGSGGDNNKGPGAVSSAVAFLKSLDDNKEKALEVFNKTCEYITKTNGGLDRIKHAFRAGCEHNFGPLLARMGVDINSKTDLGKTQVIEAGAKILIDISKKLIDMGSKLSIDAQGLFQNIVVEYDGELITVRGCIHEGVFKIGTMFIQSQHIRKVV